MAKVETWVKCDLKKAVQVQSLNGNVFSLDNNGNRICVQMFYGGEKVIVTGAVSADCILPDGSTVSIATGMLVTENNQSVAYVDIPQGVLLIPGILKITIRLTASGVVATIAAIIATVYQTKTDNEITPSQQAITDWNAEIANAIGDQNAVIERLKREIVLVQSSQPVTDYNRIWIKEPEDCDVVVPTMEDHTRLAGTVNRKVSRPMTNPDGYYGDYLRSNGDGTTFWAGIGQPTDEQVKKAVDEWLDDHPEATTTVEDGAITDAKLNFKLKLKNMLNLQSMTFGDPIPTPIAKSYVECACYLNGRYYVFFNNYSITNKELPLAVMYDSDFNVLKTVDLSSYRECAPVSCCTDGERIYLDLQYTGLKLSFDADLDNIIEYMLGAEDSWFYTCYWNGNYYTIDLADYPDPTKPADDPVNVNTGTVTINKVESDLTTIIDSHSVKFSKTEVHQSASIIDGILIIPTIDGAFHFCELSTYTLVEIPYFNHKEIENIFIGKDGEIECSGNIIGAAGMFRIGRFVGGCDFRPMQVEYIEGTSMMSDLGRGISAFNGRQAIWEITNGALCGLPLDKCTAIMTDNLRLLVSQQDNAMYFYYTQSNTPWKNLGKIVPNPFIVQSGHLYVTQVGNIIYVEAYAYEVTQDIKIPFDFSNLYSFNGFASNRTFSTSCIAKENGTGSLSGDVHAITFYLEVDGLSTFAKNLAGHSVNAFVNGVFPIYIGK